MPTMIIAGAGGHALEVLDILIEQHIARPAVYGEKINPHWPAELPAFSRLEQVSEWLSANAHFVLGLGAPEYRRKLYEEFTTRGGILHALRGALAVLSPTAVADSADLMSGAFVGAQARLGLGVLVNAGAQVHHEVSVGDFSVINPRAVLLGACQVGSGCFIGAQATILPGVSIGDRAIIGAGTVIIRDVPADTTMVGVPGRMLFKSQN